MKKDPQVTYSGMFDMQVCVPKSFSNKEVLEFASKANPCGTTSGWSIRKQGSADLQGKDERVECQGRKGYVHIMLDA